MLHFVSVRVGDKYGPEYVEILHDMLARNCSTVDHAHWCVTDDPESLPPGVNPIPHNPDLPGWWQKVWLFSAWMPWDVGERIVYMDLDVAITGRLEEFAETKGIIRDWGWPCFNSSVMVWDCGEHAQIWQRFDPRTINQPGIIVPREALPEGQINGGDQEWITEVAPDFPVLPRDWCVSYRMHAEEWPPVDAKVVVFHGEPKPAQITEGWVPQVWKVGGMTSLPEMKGVNVSDDVILDHIKASLSRKLPWFSGFGERKRAAVICCGGPSLKGSLDDIRWHARNGGRIVAVNNAWRVLQSANITPDCCILLDARPENVAFTEDAPESMRWFVASQCHEDVFKALEGRQVILWHSHIGEDIEKLVEPFIETHPVVLVPGGGTVGLRAINLCWLSGYRKIHVYGLDGSYDGDNHHAYPQALNDGEETIGVVWQGHTYRCARWMARQAEEFQKQYRDLWRVGVQVHVHGKGLIPAMAKTLKALAA